MAASGRQERANLQFGFNQRAFEADREPACGLRIVKVLDQIRCELDPPLLADHHGRAAPGPVETLRPPPMDEESSFDGPRVLVALGAVALHDPTDHQGRNLDESDQADPGAAWDLGTEDRDSPAVLGVRSRHLDDRTGIARMVGTRNLVVVQDRAGDRSVVAVVLVGRQTADCKLPALERTEPGAFERSEKFFLGKELSFREQPRLSVERPDHRMRVRIGDQRLRQEKPFGSLTG